MTENNKKHILDQDDYDAISQRFDSDESSFTEFVNRQDNPHNVTKSQVGLGNVPNVTTNDQTPTYITPLESMPMEDMSSGETLSEAFRKIAKAIHVFINNHHFDNIRHIIQSERENWTTAYKKTNQKINDTDFDPDNPITTNKWGASRKIKIGNKEINIDGSNESGYEYTLPDIGAVRVSGDTITGDLTVTGDKTQVKKLTTLDLATLQSLSVTSTAVFKDTVDFIKNASFTTLSTSGKATLNSLGVTTNATISGTLGVTGKTTIGSNASNTVIENNTITTGSVTATTFTGTLYGNAASASKLSVNENKGSSTQPIYFKNGVAEAISSVAIEYGGTGATTVDAAKTNFGLNNVDNIADANKSVKYATTAGTSNKIAHSFGIQYKGNNLSTFDGSGKNKYVNLKEGSYISLTGGESTENQTSVIDALTIGVTNVDTTNGGTSGSTSLITSGAVYSGLGTKVNSSRISDSVSNNTNIPTGAAIQTYVTGRKYAGSSSDGGAATSANKVNSSLSFTFYSSESSSSQTSYNGSSNEEIVFQTGGSNGTISIGGNNIPVKGLGSLAYKSSLAYSEVTGTPSSLKNPNSLKLQVGGTDKVTYDGSAAKSFNIASGSSNGTISFGGTDVSVKGLGSLAYKSSLAYSEITSTPSSLKNPNSLSFVLGYDTTIFDYDGSSLKRFELFAGSNISISQYKALNGGVGSSTYSQGYKIGVTGVSLEGHTHTKSDITDFPSSLKNPNSLILQGNGTTLTNGTYDGSSSKTVNITPSAIGAATSDHTHDQFGSFKISHCEIFTLNNPWSGNSLKWTSYIYWDGSSNATYKLSKKYTSRPQYAIVQSLSEDVQFSIDSEYTTTNSFRISYRRQSSSENQDSVKLMIVILEAI